MFRMIKHEPVFKAKRVTFPNMKKYQTYQRMADAMTGFMVTSLDKGIKSFRKRIDIEKLAEAVAGGNVNDVIALYPLVGLGDELGDYKKNISALMVDSGLLTFKDIPRVRNPLFTFDTENPHIKRTVDKNIGKLIENVTEESRLAAVDMVTQSWNRGLPPRKSAKLIKGTFGLNNRQALASLNYSDNLEKAGIKGLKQERLVDDYVDKSLRYRENMIARTESIRAVNLGQIELWDQAADAGLYDRGRMRKVWVVTLDDMTCPWCTEMSGQYVEVDQNFQSPEFGSVESPPLHPHCRCMMNLEEVSSE